MRGPYGMGSDALAASHDRELAVIERADVWEASVHIVPFLVQASIRAGHDRKAFRLLAGVVMRS